MNIELRAIAALGLLLVLAGAANAQTAQTPRAGLPAPDNFLDIATFSLWDGDAPGALGARTADIPTLTVFRCWWTFGSILMTTSPPRWIIPKTSGFSFSRVPRPRARFNRRGRPGRPFFHRFGMAFVASDVDLVAFDSAFELQLWFEINHPGAQVDSHLMDIILTER